MPVKPEQIEAESFRIIDDEAGPHGFSPTEWRIVRRVVHTTADFEYVRTLRIHSGAISSGIAAIRSGKPVFTDTQMALSGIRKSEIARFGGTVTCLIGDPEVRKVAGEQETTRARVAVDAAVLQMEGGIYAIGNAPTALLRLIELIQADRAHPALVIGLPVGFVNAAESKDALLRLDCPHITNIGRKGGSNVAAAVVNALAIMAAEGE